MRTLIGLILITAAQMCWALEGYYHVTSDMDIFIKKQEVGDGAAPNYYAMILNRDDKKYSSALFRIEFRGEDHVWMPLYLQGKDNILSLPPNYDAYFVSRFEGSHLVLYPEKKAQDNGCGFKYIAEKRTSKSWDQENIDNTHFREVHSRKSYMSISAAKNGSIYSGNFYYPEMSFNGPDKPKKYPSLSYEGEFFVETTLGGFSLMKSLQFDAYSVEGRKITPEVVAVVTHIKEDRDQKMLLIGMVPNHVSCMGWRTIKLEEGRGEQRDKKVIGHRPGFFEILGKENPRQEGSNQERRGR